MPPRPRRRVVVVDRQGGAGHVLLTAPRSTGGRRRGSAGERTPELKRLPDRTGAPSVAGPGGGAGAARPGRFLGVGPEGEEPATYPVRLSTAHPLPTARPGDTAASAEPADRAEEPATHPVRLPTARPARDAAASADPADRETPDGVPEPEPPPGSPPGRFGPALRERLPLWVQARCGLERRSVVALAALLALALVLAVQHFWTGRTQPVRAPEVVRAAPAAQREGTDGGRDPSAAPGSFGQAGGTAAPEIVVDVSGKVRDPGVHRLPAGSRVEDALKAAGGVRPGTKTDGLNRARFLVDGEQLTVGGPAPAAAAAPAGTGAAAGPTAPVSLNTATVDQLDTLPGVGPVLAQHIVDYRTRNGGFRSVDELREVNGIGDRRFADLRDLVRP
ncbi:helix-hairpin-helix domain-containing protein [Streptomyces althioticus]|uniref:helix-hairpin-helix domain-containing protein n=2 Tax=Streptomyces althioticus group TaxID=2867194 RepID=UPI00378C595B